MNKLDELIKKFESDSDWNTEYKDGTKRFDKKLVWLRSMIIQYAERFGLSVNEVVDNFESKRTYSWPNYYQESNFLDLSTTNKILIFENIEDFKNKKLMFKCSKCGTVSNHPQECKHRVNKDGKCDWCAYGLLKSPYSIILKSDSLVPIPTFEPILNY